MTTFNAEEYSHRVGEIKEDLSSETVFQWHFPRGTFEPRMSAREIAPFLIGHMPAIVPLLGHHPRIQAEFAAMLVRLVTWPEPALDELATWIRPVLGKGDDDLIQLSLFAKEPIAAGPSYFLQ